MLVRSPRLALPAPRYHVSTWLCVLCVTCATIGAASLATTVRMAKRELAELPQQLKLLADDNVQSYFGLLQLLAGGVELLLSPRPPSP